MRLGLLSDTHDDTARTRRAVDLLQEAGAEVLLHLGDMTSPGTVELLEGTRLWVVRGNMDRDPSGLEAAVEALEPAGRFATTHELELDGVRIGMAHGHQDARLQGMITSRAFDLVLHGHTHAFRDDRVGSTRVVNPGAVHRASTPSVCVYDTGSDTLERLRL